MAFTSFLRALLLSFLVFVSSVAYAGSLIQNIRIQGNERIETATVLSYLTLAPGQVYTQEQADASLRQLYDAGLFAQATIGQEGSTVIVTVKENPMVSRIAFEGNSRIKKDVLLKEMTLKPRMVMTKARVRQDVERIVDIYRKSGRYGVHVEPKMIVLPENRVNIVYEITEGSKTPILKLLFVGNKSFKDSALQAEVQSHPYRWYRFFSSNDTYDPDRLEMDKMLLTKFYQSQGFADMSVQSVKSLLTPDRKGFYVTFVIDEGPVYHISSVSIDCGIPHVDVTALEKKGLKIGKGELYSIEQIDESIDTMTDMLGDQGYAFVNIDPILERDAASSTIKLTFKIERAPKVYINKINIKGNVRTYDKVIRRELMIEEDDPFNYSKIRRSREQVEELEYFKMVDIKPVSTKGAPDRVDLDVAIKEKSTGSLSLSVGASSTDGLIANIGFNEINFLGRGQTVGASVGKSRYTTELGFNFTQPHFMDTNVDAGVDASHYDMQTRAGHRYKERTDAISLRASYPLTERLRHTVFYALAQSRYRAGDVPWQTTPIAYAVKNMLGERITSSVGQKFFYNRLNSLLAPTKGYYIMADQTIAGVGGDSRYTRHTGKIGFYAPLYKDKFIIQASAGVGVIEGYGGRKVLLSDRFQLGGGDEFRGFDYNGIGPRERTPNGPGEPLGGKMRYIMRSQINMPIGLPEEYGIKWFPFLDAGSVLRPELDPGITRNMIYYDKSMRISTGVGIGWASPIGHITISYGRAVKKRFYDETEKLQFSFGTSL